MAIEADIHLAIMKKIEASDLSPVAYPNVSYNGSKPYYKVNILPIPTEPYAVKDTNVYRGMVQIDAVASEGDGSTDIYTMVSLILGVFPRPTYVTEGTTELRFDTAGYVAPAIQMKDEYRIPVTFNYILIAKE